MKKHAKKIIVLLLTVAMLVPTVAMIFSNAAIAEFPVELAFNNIFVFDKWANHTVSTTIINSGVPVNDKLGIDIENGSIHFNNPYSGEAYTAFSMNPASTNPEVNFNYYMMDIEPGITYTYSYNITSLTSGIFMTPYIFYFDENGGHIRFDSHSSTATGADSFEFTAPENAKYAQTRFTISGTGSVDIKDIAIQKKLGSSDTSEGVPNRIVYTYSSEQQTTYGTLPVPVYAPDGYVFAGWYTGVNGTGELITENTPVDYESYTVYAKYEPIVNSISIKTLPVKTTYTVGERVNPTGLVLEARTGNTTATITEGYRCTPEYLTETGTQTITVHYGGKTTTYTVEVSASASKSVVVNGSTVNVSVTNNVYTFESAVSTGEFNKYAITYSADAYFEGIITYSDNTTEQFFLEPSSNFASGETPKFSSFIDGYLEKVVDGAGNTTAVNSHIRNGIKSIAFKPLDNKSGTFDLLSITTSKANQITNAANTMQYFTNSQYKVGIDILNGGVVAELYVLNDTGDSANDVVARVYEHADPDGNKTYETMVDYRKNLATGYKSESTNVNLINTADTGRYLQQSYYGTQDKPYETTEYNRTEWRYNPVQGGNVANEASKVLDYEITSEYIYIKARPLDWSKWSDDHAGKCNHEGHDAHWGDEYISDTYMEAKYVFKDGYIETYCRMVDYSGLPSALATQEMPAFYTIEPLNEFVYNNVSADDAWQIQNLKYETSPEFWGVLPDYINKYYPNGFNPNVNATEGWAAFMAGQGEESFGVGIYSPETTAFSYGSYPQKYNESTGAANFRHATTTNPAAEAPTSYIVPHDARMFESFTPAEYSYTLTTGTVDEIRGTFGSTYTETYVDEMRRTNIAVPETIYMTPNADKSTTGQYFVNNWLDANGNLHVDATSNATKGIISVYSPGSTAISFNVTAVNGGIGDPVIGNGTTSGSYENHQRWDHNVIYTAYSTGATEDWFLFNDLGLAINGTGVSEGATALLEWEIKVYYGNDDTVGETHYAYTTLYSPWIEPVGAALRGYTRGKEVYDQAVAWVSGVHGYTANSSGKYWVAATNQTLNNEGNFQGDYYAKTSSYALVPLLYGIGNPGNTTTGITSFIQNTSPGGGITSPTIRYTTRRSSSGDYGILLSEISPVANITVDTSRYTNFNQIPNLTVGYNITDVENSKGVIWYVSDLTDIANAATDATTHEVKFYNYTYSDSSKNTANKSTNEWFDGKSTGNLIYGDATTNRSVSSGVEYHAAWNRQVITGSSTYDYMFKGASHAHYNSDARAYIMNHVQLRASNVNKANLRDLVLVASSLIETNYTSASWSAFKTALRNAANELGNPTDSDVSAVYTELKNKMDALQTPVTLIANGGNFSNGATTTTVNLTCGFDFTVDYTIPASSNPTLNGFEVQGWATEADATEGTNPVTGGLKPTFYAIWTEGSYTVVYNSNNGYGYIPSVTVKFTESFNLASTGYTRDGYSMVGWSTNASATTADYLPGQTVSGLANTTGATITLYAVWTESKYTVVYDANGGSGSIASKTVRVSETFTLPSSGFTRDEYTLIGWATTSTATAPEYQLGQSVNRLAATGSITLYAVWMVTDPLVEDTVIIDFATPVVISPIDNDKGLKSMNATYKLTGISSDGENYASTLNGDYGSFSVSGEKVTYTPSTTVDGTEVIYYHVSVLLNGTTPYHIKETITVAPASNILYEETELTVSNTTGVAWGTVGETATANQTSSTEIDVYGYDSNTDGYNKISNYSNGSALAVTVDADNKRSHNLSFEFEGTGFDLNSACGYNTGVMIVSVKNLSTQKMVKSYIVDTYYSDCDDKGNDKYSNTLYQVPIINETTLPHDNYLIQISASYLPSMSGALSTQALGEESNINAAASIDEDALRAALTEIGMEYILDAEEVNVVWFDEDSVLNGGDGVNTIEEGMLETQAVTKLLNIVDSVRVYNPITDGDLYYSDSEKGAQYYNVIDNLVKADGSFSIDKLFSYIIGNDQGEITVENYDVVGPKDELYLTNGTGAVTFSIKDFDSSTSKVMISLRAASTTTANPKVNVKIGSNDFDVTSNTEMYYDITDYVVNGTVTIQNMTSGTLLSVGSVKITSTINQVALLSSDFDLATASFMMMAPSSTVEPNNVHNYDAVVTEPTCTEQGYTTYTCKCGNTYIADYVTAVGHKHSTVVTDPTCTEQGYTTYTCDCGDTYVADYVAAIGHKHTAEVTTPATQLEDGVMTYTCDCGDTYTEIIPKLTEPEDTTDPTEPEDTTDPDDTDDPADSDDSTEFWLIRVINWIIEMFNKIFAAINSILGF